MLVILLQTYDVSYWIWNIRTIWIKVSQGVVVEVVAEFIGRQRNALPLSSESMSKPGKQTTRSRSHVIKHTVIQWYMRMRLQRDNGIYAAELGSLRTVNWFTHNASLSRIIQLRLLKPTHRGWMVIPRSESRSRQLPEGWQGYLNLQVRKEVSSPSETLGSWVRMFCGSCSLTTDR